MKKFMFAAMAALAITSCSQNEELEAPSQKAEIGFNTVVGKSTRAAEAKIADLEKNGFILYGYNTAEVSMSAEAVLDDVFMDSAVASFLTPNWSLTKGPYYWPVEGNIQFFGFSPITNVTTYAVGAKGYPSFSYIIQPRASQEDLIVVHTPNQTKAQTIAPVNLVFKHVLTQINFKLKGEVGFTYSVTDIKIAGVKNTGTFTYASDKGSWASTGDNADYVYDITYPCTVNGITETVIATGNNSLMLLPQTLGTDAKIVVTYSALYKGKQVFDGVKDVTLNTTSWGVGSKILYTLTLPGGADEMTFNPSVGKWDDETETPKDL